MEDKLFAEQLCALKKYLLIIRDKKTSIDPFPPRVEIKAQAMGEIEKWALESLMGDYKNDIYTIADFLLRKRMPSKWGRYHDQQFDLIDPKQASHEKITKYNENILEVVWYVINRIIRLSCKFRKYGNNTLRKYLNGILRHKYEVIEWRRFIGHVDTNIPEYIKKSGQLHIEVFKYFRKNKIKYFDRDNVFTNEFFTTSKELSKELNTEVNSVYKICGDVVTKCLDNGDYTKIFEDNLIGYEQDYIDPTQRSLIDEYSNSSNYEEMQVLEQYTKALKSIIDNLTMVERQLLSIRYDVDVDEKKLILNGKNYIGNRIATELKIYKEKDIYNRIDTIINRVLKGFKKNYQNLISENELTDKSLKSIVKNYVLYFHNQDENA